MIPWLSELTFTTSAHATNTCIRYQVSDRPLEGQAVAILGGGPAMSGQLAGRLAAHKAIAVNNSYQFFKRPCLLVALDRRWWTWHGNNVRSRGDLGIQALRPNQTAYPGFSGYVFAKEREPVYSPDPGVLCGQNSGHAAIHLAMHLGASRIYLAGFDMGFKGSNTHWHGGHVVPASQANYERRFLPALEALVQEAKFLGVSISAVTRSYADIPFTHPDEALGDLG